MDKVTGELLRLTILAVQGLCDSPEQVKVEPASEGPVSICLVVTCATKDIPKIIGSQGKNVGALRTLLMSIASKHKKRITLLLRE